MMNRILSVVILVWGTAILALAQGSTSTRPRVAATPPPAPPPVIQGEEPTDSRAGGPPTLIGDQSRRPQPTPSFVTPEAAYEIIKIDTNLVTMPVTEAGAPNIDRK